MYFQSERRSFETVFVFVSGPGLHCNTICPRSPAVRTRLEYAELDLNIYAGRERPYANMICYLYTSLIKTIQFLASKRVTFPSADTLRQEVPPAFLSGDLVTRYVWRFPVILER